jgi:UDP-N-acetylmuramoylalanine--D-glutamate ligase
MPFPNFQNKKILILGLGLLGRGVKDTIFFALEGAKVTVTDLKSATELASSLAKLKKFKNIKYVLGAHRYEDIDAADLILRNADVPPTSPFLLYAEKQGKRIEMDESLFAEYCPCPIIGITGTRGKSTTTALIYELLKNTGKKIHLGGNVLDTATLPLIKKVKKNDLVVLELSSWQLQGFGAKKISPAIAVFTNVYPDHLNRYSGMEAYIADKKFIYQNQKPTDCLVINRENPTTKKLMREAKAQVISFTATDVPRSWKLKISGEHNRENIAAAIQVAKIFKIPASQIKKTVEEFGGIEHRLEFVRELHGVRFVNDTTSTTPIAGQKALAAIKGSIVLIAGGADKKIDLTDFARDLVKKVKKVILLNGTATDKLENLIKNFHGDNLIVGRFDNFKTAIQKAQEVAAKGDTILLSPGSASFGLFKNEFDRGQQFKTIVKKLK